MRVLTRLMQALPPRILAVMAVWLTAAVTLGVMLRSPMAIAVLTTAILVLTLVFERADTVAGRASSSVHRALVSDGQDGDTAFAQHFVAKEFAAARRGRKLTLVMFGLSRLEAFTEQHGAEAAAVALRSFGRLLQQMTREMNLSSRCGWRADAFLSVLADADAAAAEVFIARVRGAAAASTVPMPDVAAGITVYQPHLASPEEFVECAERALAAARAAAGTVQRPRREVHAYGGRARRLQAS
jgi:GGDEF domain-containing protein